MQTLAQNDITSARWQRPFPGYYGFTFVQWEEAETCYPSFIQCIIIITGANKQILFTESD